jgi:hypothetical protein
MKRIYKGLEILIKYGDGHFTAEHDEVWAGSDNAIPEKMSKEDLCVLENLRWTYEEGCGWHHFT